MAANRGNNGGGNRLSPLESHRPEAQLEDVLWLVSDGGCTLEQACARVGVTVAFVEQRTKRAAAKVQPDDGP